MASCLASEQRHPWATRQKERWCIWVLLKHGMSFCLSPALGFAHAFPRLLAHRSLESGWMQPRWMWAEMEEPQWQAPRRGEFFNQAQSQVADSSLERRSRKCPILCKSPSRLRNSSGFDWLGI